MQLDFGWSFLAPAHLSLLLPASLLFLCQCLVRHYYSLIISDSNRFLVTVFCGGNGQCCGLWIVSVFVSLPPPLILPEFWGRERAVDMSTATPNTTTRSSENLRIQPQPIDQVTPAAKNLGLPDPSRILTPPLSLFQDRRTCSHTSSCGRYVGNQDFNSLSTPPSEAARTLLSLPTWASNMKEPVKRSPVSALFALPTPSPPPHSMGTRGGLTIQ